MLATVFRGGEIEKIIKIEKLENSPSAHCGFSGPFRFFLLCSAVFCGTFSFSKRSMKTSLGDLQLRPGPASLPPEFCATSDRKKPKKKEELLEDSNHVQLLLFRVDLQLHFHQLLLFLFINQAIIVQLSIFRGSPKKIATPSHPK